jgi:hypothetical protein
VIVVGTALGSPRLPVAMQGALIAVHGVARFNAATLTT